tara:strand:+ start:206 stop:454 length:249 start_codon:yes stop_codon:yes gene_type:complete
MIFKCTARYEVIKDITTIETRTGKRFTNRAEIHDLGKITHTIYSVSSFKEAEMQFDIIIEGFKKLFNDSLVSIQIVEISEDK